ncbi:MAG: lytic transglycosylase domain-containing protein, partial [Mesorhizobium sp.]
MQRLLRTALILICALIPAGQAFADPPQSRSAAKRLINRVCDLIETQAEQNGLPKDFFARLIWKESRFDPNAVSPVGAEGIAQFMPGTAKLRGLADPFDIGQAIPASAK